MSAASLFALLHSVSRRAECHYEQEQRRCKRLHHVRGFVSLQRVCQAHHPGRWVSMSFETFVVSVGCTLHARWRTPCCGLSPLTLLFRPGCQTISSEALALGAKLNCLFLNTDTSTLLTPLSLGLKEVVYLSDKYHKTPGMIASRRLLDMAGIQYRYRNGQNTNVLTGPSSSLLFCAISIYFF